MNNKRKMKKKKKEGPQVGLSGRILKQALIS
jgi:hypothetical protein